MLSSRPPSYSSNSIGCLKIPVDSSASPPPLSTLTAFHSKHRYYVSNPLKTSHMKTTFSQTILRYYALGKIPSSLSISAWFLLDLGFYSIFSCCCPFLFSLFSFLFPLSLCQLSHTLVTFLILNHAHGLFVPLPRFAVVVLDLFGLNASFILLCTGCIPPTIYLRIVFTPHSTWLCFRVHRVGLASKDSLFFFRSPLLLLLLPPRVYTLYTCFCLAIKRANTSSDPRSPSSEWSFTASVPT